MDILPPVAPWVPAPMLAIELGNIPPDLSALVGGPKPATPRARYFKQRLYFDRASIAPAKTDAKRNSLSRLRLQRLAESLHALGPKPLSHFLDEVERGAPLRPHLERYAALPAGFIRANGGDQFPPALRAIDGGRRP